MKLHELSDRDKERIYWEARPILEGQPRELLGDPPTDQQLQALRLRNFFFGPNYEVMRAAMSGNLRECAFGIPCTWYCGGWADGKCPERLFPKCGNADGKCLTTGQPCNAHCDPTDEAHQFKVINGPSKQ